MSVKLGVVPACLYISNSPMMFLSNRCSFRPETSGAYTLRRRGRGRSKSGSAIGACAVARLAGNGGSIGDYHGSANSWLRRGGYPWQDDPYLEEYPYEFAKAGSVEELRGFFAHGNWALRQGIVYLHSKIIYRQFLTFLNSSLGYN